MVGASRERVNKAIASFVRLGWIEQSDRRYRSPTASSSPAAPASHAHTPYRRRKLEHPAPGVGGVVGAVGGARRVVDEAVLGALVRARPSTPAASSAATSSGGVQMSAVPMIAIVGQRSGRREEVERLTQLVAAPLLGDADHPVERGGAVEPAECPRPSA